MTYQFKSEYLQREADNGFVELAMFEGDNEAAVVKNGDDSYVVIIFNYGAEVEFEMRNESAPNLKAAISVITEFLTFEYSIE